MSDQVMTVTVKGIGDFSDVVSNVGSVQKALTKLKLPDKLGDSLNKNITAFYKEYEKYQKKITEGVKTQGDYNQVEKSLNNMRSLYQAIGKDAQKLTQLDMKDMLNLDTGEVKKIMDELTSVVKQIGSVKIDTAPFTKAFADIRNITKNSKISGDNGLLSQIIGSVNTGQIAAAKKQLQELENYAKKVAPRTTETGARMPGTLSAEKYQQLTAAIGVMNGAVAQAEAAMNPLIERQNDLQRELDETKQKAAQGIKDEFDGYNQASGQVDNLTESLKRMHQEEFSFNREAQNIDRQIQSYFGLSQMIRKVGDIAKDAFATVKELDKAMTETAVVTNFSVGDMWEMLPTYTAQANQLGSTIKDVYDAATLYYQQGLNTNQAMSLANETLKMARIAGLDAADATNMMTAALRGFNMEINQQSAQKINDIYSELAAITASDTKEIGSAMERTASIANSANMEFATTSAFLAQMIETTREAPENLGTAMKTIVARFQEMKKDPTKLIDSEGVAMDANKVDTALKSIGVQLMNTKGEFRDLDDVFLDIASKWDSLSQGQQRYIATIAAGSRQQSRFIAMMSNYERTMELVDAANNSAGASQRQFEKTLDSMEAKLNMLKNAWDQFTMGLMNNQILKFGVDALTEGFTIVNKFIDVLGKLPPKPFEGITKSVLTLVTTLGMLNFGKKASRGLIMGGAGWWKGETSLTGGFSQGWKDASRSGFFGKGSNAKQQGLKDGAEYSRGFNQGALKINLKANGLMGTMKSAYAQIGKKAIGWDTIQSNKMATSSPVSQIVNQLLPEDAITAEATNQLQKAIDEAGGNVRLGVSNYKKKTGKGKFFTDKEAENLQQQYNEIQSKTKIGDGLEEGANKAEKFGASITNAGQSLQLFGTYLENTPLAPFGSLLSSVGSLLMSFGSTIGWVGTTWAASVEAAGGATLSATAMMKAGITGVTEALMASPVFWIAAAVLAVVAAVKIADAAIETQAEKLEKAEDAAASASEAYDSAKQETSELADSITKIQETDSAFDGLVAGTAEFNEQLVTANEQIMALIDKYPMLLDASKNYVTTDDNGLMHISEAGFKAVKEYQKQIQANASAMNLIQTADLNALEHQQKANELRKKINGSRRGEMTEAEAKEHEKNLREADMLDQRAEAETRLARSNAIRTALAGKELRDVDSLTSVYTNLYDTKRKAAEVQVNGMGKHDIRQQYADYHGYTYDRSTKKITDVEGNEVDYDDKVIKDEVIEQTVLLDFEANASTLEGVLNEVDAKFADTLDSTSESSAHFISDVLANNINTDEDILEKALSGNDFQDAVNSMTEKEMAAILGINAESINEQNIDAKRDEIVDLLTNNATKIAEAQSKSYENLATMMAQSKGWDTFDAEQKASQDIIRKEIRDLTAEQAHMMSDIGSQLKEGAGMEAMQIYMNRMSDLYKNINESGKQSDKDAAKEIEDIFNSVDLTSATGRLEAYTKMANSASNEVRKLGEDMHASAGEANLLGKTFDEFLGGDWLELAENADDFKNSLGQIDAAGILKASEQSHTLKTMLDSGEASASGLALALQGVEDGKFSIGAVNDSVLQLLSSLNRVEDEALKAHELIANFDAGIDYGEAADFAKENAEKAQEYWNNGEYGNQQLQNYIKLAAGQERWNEALKASGGDLEQAEKGLLKYVTTFKDGFEPVIDQLVSGKGINGEALSKNLEEAVAKGKIDEALYNKFKEVVPRIEGDDFIFGTEASKATDLTTNELKTYLEQVYGVSTEYAQLILEEWTNLSPNLAAELSKNDLIEATSSESFKNAHTDTNGNVILTDQEIKVIEDAGGNLDQIATNLGTTVDALKSNQFNVLDEEGNRRTDYNKMLRDYIQTYETGSRKIGDLRQNEELLTGGNLDISKLVTALQSKGFDQEQSMRAAWEAYRQNDKVGETTSYEGVDLDKGIATYEEFTASIESALEASKWQSIGEAIAQGIINFINGKDPGEQKTGEGMTQTEANKASMEASRAGNEKAINDITNLFGKIGGAIEKLNTPERIQKGQDQKTFGGMNQQPTPQTDTGKLDASGDKLTGAGDSLTDAANQFISGINSLTTAGDNLNTAATNLTSAATAISTNSKMSGMAKDSKSSGGSGSSKASLSPQKATMSVSTGPVDTKTVDAAKTKIAGDSAKLPVKTKDETAEGLKAIKNKIKNTSASVTIKATAATSNISVTVRGNAQGRNNYIPHQSIPSLGSLAKGTRYGRLGPKGKGGLTLTGEKGYEIAWLPDESRSMILGVDGPQMINLPANAVVYTHEQSEDILRKRQEIEAGSHFKIDKGGGKNSKKKKKKKKGKKSKGSSKNTTPTINNWSIEEAVRYNIDQSLASITEEISLRTKEIEKNLEKIGTTYNDIVGSTQAQIAALEQVKQKNQELLASNQRQLADYRAQQQYVSWTDSNGESQRTLINIGQFLASDGKIDYNAIQSFAGGNRALQEALFKEVSSGKGMADGMRNALKAIADADQQIADLGKKISEAFYQWENELTEVYSLTKRINNEVSFTNRFTSQVELELAKLGAGFTDTAKAIANTRNVLIRNNATIQAQIKNQQQMVAARQRELEAALSYEDEVNKYKKFEAKTDWDSEATKTATLEWAKNLETGARLGYKYVADSIFKDIDGSIQYQIDWEKFNADNEANPYSKADYEAIKKYLDELDSAATEFNNSIKDQTDFIKQTYDALKEYQDYVADMEDTLIKGVEEQIEQAKDNAKQLSDSITSALKDLLDEVKRKLDERRKQEDNAKTERDISQKQQRLAMLRADTAGGHQVEIAQLEKEIADSQQSYQRTLEDQLLDRLQQQADEASEQRERQIELATASNELLAENNKLEVDKWLRDPETFKEQIKAAWLEAQGYDEKGEAGQYVLESQFESDFAQLVTAVEESNFKDSFNALTADTNSLAALLNELTNGQLGREDELAHSTNALLDVTDRNTTSILTEMQKQNSVAMLRAKGADAATLKTLGYSAKDMLEGGYELAELQKVGYTAAELKEGGINDVGALKGVGYSAKDLKDAGFDIGEIIINYGADEAKKAGFNINDFDAGNIDYSTAKSVFDLNSLAGSGTRYADIAQGELDAIAAAEAERQRQAAAAAEAERQRQAAAQAAWNAAHPYGLISSYSGTIDSGDKGNKVKAVQNALNRIIGAGLAVDGSFGSKTKNAVKKFQKATGISADGKVGNKTKGKFAAYGYKTGGLADYTGPAWLDGTPSKPELVLNPTDTKNFLALRDVLSSAMKSTGSVNNSYGGDTTYEININVDKLTSDYDVDKVAERVKKIIVKDSSYRNVTQVRNLR